MGDGMDGVLTWSLLGTDKAPMSSSRIHKPSCAVSPADTLRGIAEGDEARTVIRLLGPNPWCQVQDGT